MWAIPHKINEKIKSYEQGFKGHGPRVFVLDPPRLSLFEVGFTQNLVQYETVPIACLRGVFISIQTSLVSSSAFSTNEKF